MEDGEGERLILRVEAIFVRVICRDTSLPVQLIVCGKARPAQACVEKLSTSSAAVVAVAASAVMFEVDGSTFFFVEMTTSSWRGRVWTREQLLLVS